MNARPDQKLHVPNVDAGFEASGICETRRGFG